MENPKLCDSPVNDKNKDTSRGRSLLYRCEYGGILVYDCYSRLSTSSTAFQDALIEQEPELRKNVSVKGVGEYGNI